VNVENPKSISFILFLGSMMIFSSLISQWAIPLRWQWWIALNIYANISLVSGSLSQVFVLRNQSNEIPSTYSRTIFYQFADSNASLNLTIFGW